MLVGQAEPLFQVIIQGGSFAILAYLIIFGLPALHKAISKERQEEREATTAERQQERSDFKAALDAVVKEQADSRKEFSGSLKAVSDVFRVEAKEERLACEKHFETLAGAVGKGNEVTVQAVKAIAEQIQANAQQLNSHAQRNQQWVEMLQKAARESETRKGGA